MGCISAEFHTTATEVTLLQCAHTKESHLIELCANVPENTMPVVFQG